MEDISVKPVKAASSDYEIKQVDFNPVGQTGHIDKAVLYQRIDCRIVPLMFLCYLYLVSCYTFSVLYLT